MNDFSKKMNEVVYPYINKHCTEDYFYNSDGSKLRYKHYTVNNSCKSVLIIHGFSEFIDKYDEVIYNFMQAGIEVFALELRGHGYSTREVNDICLVHIDSFSKYINDIHSFVEKYMCKEKGEKILFAHSMGGGIGANYIDKYPDDFDKVILSSPMIKMRTGKLPYTVVINISKIMSAFGKSKKYAVGQHKFPGENYKKDMTDRQRFYFEKRLNNPSFQTWGASYGWIKAAGENTKEISSVLKSKVKMLILIAGNDDMVIPSETIKYAKRQRNAKYVLFENGMHELFNDSKKISDQFWSEIFEFIK